MKKFLAFLLLSLACLDARAIIPENGWWWNPALSGSGFNLEVQDDSAFFAAFAYDASGNPTWITAAGPMTSDRDFSGNVITYSGGSCYGCTYRNPTGTPAGTLTLRFTSSQTAVLTINGVSDNVQRFDFTINAILPDAMLGEWSMVIGDSSLGSFFGERVQYRGKSSDSTGPYLVGNRLGVTNAAAARYSAPTGTYSSVLDSSPSFYRYSEWTSTGFNRIEGYTWLYDKGASPQGSGTFFQGYRSASRSFVQTGTGPASSKAFPIDDASSSDRDRAQMELAAKGTGPLFEADAARITRFQAMRSVAP
jgi:hypothetical protein